MNIKSLLLGSAAALVAVSGARAADAIVIAEPEPVEYVRVCDAFGTGFFYIPGTETCLKFDGYVRYQINTNKNGYFAGRDYYGEGVNDYTNVYEDGFRKNVRGRLNVDARSDTEWGTLRAFLRFQADTNGFNSDAGFGMDQAIVQLGGFYAGYTESAFAAPWGLPGIARFGIFHTDQGGSYDYHQVQQIGYTFSGGNGLFGSIVLEEDSQVLPYAFYDADGDLVRTESILTEMGDGYIPDIVGVIGISQGWGGAWIKAGYDESSSTGGVALGMQYNMPNMPGSNLRAGLFWASDEGDYDYDAERFDYNTFAIAMPIAGKAEWSAAVSYHQQFNAQWGAEIGFQYFQGFDDLFGEDSTGYQVEAAAVWVPVTNFEVRLEGHYYNQDFDDYYEGDEDNWDGFLRFTRYF